MRPSLFRGRPWTATLLVLLPAGAASVAFAADKNAAESPATRRARQHVAEALQAEARGDNLLRTEEVAAALAADPEFAAAQWHSARVRSGDRWLALTEAEQQAADNPRLAEYRRLRSAAIGNPKLLRSLARWCTKTG